MRPHPGSAKPKLRLRRFGVTRTEGSAASEGTSHAEYAPLMAQRHVSYKVALQAAIDRGLQVISLPKVLEAGCGSTTNIRLPANSHVTGIDISEGD